MAERGADDIQRDIERARVNLANVVDQIAYRTAPKRLVENTKQSLIAKANSPQGKAVIGAVGVVVLLLVVRRVRHRGE